MAADGVVDWETASAVQRARMSRSSSVFRPSCSRRGAAPEGSRRVGCCRRRRGRPSKTGWTITDRPSTTATAGLPQRPPGGEAPTLPEGAAAAAVEGSEVLPEALALAGHDHVDYQVADDQRRRYRTEDVVAGTAIAEVAPDNYPAPIDLRVRTQGAAELHFHFTTTPAAVREHGDAPVDQRKALRPISRRVTRDGRASARCSCRRKRVLRSRAGHASVGRFPRRVARLRWRRCACTVRPPLRPCPTSPARVGCSTTVAPRAWVSKPRSR